MPSLLSSLFTGVSGLTSNSEAMGIIGDNISNANTVSCEEISARSVPRDCAGHPGIRGHIIY